MKKLLVILITILLGVTGCEERKQIDGNELIVVDVTARYPKKEVALQDILDVEYIPLETNDEFIHQGYLRAIGKNTIVVRNWSRDGDLFIYDRNGKALKKINRRGGSNEEYTSATEIILNEENNELLVCDALENKIMMYDLEGNFKRRFSLDPEIDYHGIFSFDRDHLIINEITFDYEYGVKDTPSFLILSKQDGSLTRTINIPFHEKKSFLIIVPEVGVSFPRTYNPVFPYRNGFILTEQSSDTIYMYSTDHQMTPWVVRTPSIQSMEQEIFLFPTFLTDEYYFLTKVEKVWDFNLRKGFPNTHVMYDRQKNALNECVIYNDDFKDKNHWISHAGL
ncbi:MAG: 6-bladed beta-propeller [Firmicutes bacterium]|nr:6-bladed beta-propeller [Bacillota bacterium]